LVRPTGLLTPDRICSSVFRAKTSGVVTYPHQPVAVSQPPSLSETPMATATDGC
jgi:hypothetical protein